MGSFNFPLLNASLNGLAAVFLILGWRAIKKGDRTLHQKMMTVAFIVSSLFLCSYVTYHIIHHGVTHYQRQGILRPIYFFILSTHTPLAMIIVPFCIMAINHAYKGRFDKHTQITRWLIPVWIYVSVTGVVIYLMLYIF